MEWPSDIFNLLYTKDVFTFSTSHRNIFVGKFRHGLLIWLTFSYVYYIMLPSPAFLTSVLRVVLFCQEKKKICSFAVW